jgi:hypothetical protein
MACAYYSGDALRGGSIGCLASVAVAFAAAVWGSGRQLSFFCAGAAAVPLYCAIFWAAHCAGIRSVCCRRDRVTASLICGAGIVVVAPAGCADPCA